MTVAGCPQARARCSSHRLSPTVASPFRPSAIWQPSLSQAEEGVTRALAYKKAASVQIQARFYGNLQWICPKCSHMHAGPKEKVDWRGPRAVCSRCKTAFQVGIAFFNDRRTHPPFNGWYSTAICGWTANIVDQLPPGRHLIGRLAGTIWWICGCRTLRRSEIDWETGDIRCIECQSCYNVGMILYRSSRRKQRMPLDWVLPIWQDQ